MEKEKSLDPNSEQELQSLGKQAADTLRSYGYPDLAQEYERSLRRASLEPKEMLTHSRIASATLKELNELSQEKLAATPGARQPGLERNIALQEKLEATLQGQKQRTTEPSRSIQDLSFPAKMYLEENSKPLANAAQEVRNYLDEKRNYSHAAEGKTQLQSHLDIQLQSYRSLPTSFNMERLERYTQQGIEVMRKDFDRTKTALQKENEDYVRERMHLSPEGKTSILREVEKGEFMMPNQQRGYIVESRTNYAEQQLDQYAKTKEQIFSIDQERKEEPGRQPASWKQALSNPVIDRAEAKAAESNVGKDTVEKDFSHLSAEQQARYAQLGTNIVSTQTNRDQEMEM